MTLSDLRQSILHNVEKTFTTMIDGVEISTAADQDPKPFRPMSGISGSVGLAGAYQGLVAVHLPEAVAMAITGAFLGMDVEEMGEEVRDAIGELTNMIGGGIKFDLPEQGGNVKLSIPTVICGQNYSLGLHTGDVTTAVTFNTPHGPFLVEALLRQGD